MNPVRWLASTWQGASVRARVHAVLLLVVTGAAIGHQAAMWQWFIEDAAISFAYARHWVDGEGLVPFPGGEVVEGFSNPLWVAVLAGLHALGLDLFVAVKWIQVGFTAATVPVTYLAAREAAGRDSDIPIVAAALLAAHSPFAIWGSAGLENGLLNLLFALGLWRMWVEVRTGRWPLSALLWLGVALCRPETILYAAIAGSLTMVFHLQDRRGLKPTLVWLLLFFVPFLSWQALRYAWFAWPFPNTYYAKERPTETIRWTRRAWMWSRRYAEELGHGFLLPVYLLGLVGRRGWRLLAALIAFALVTTVVELSHDQRWLLPAWIGVLWAGWWIGVRHAGRPPPALARGGLLAAVLLVGVSEWLRTRGVVPGSVPTAPWFRQGPPSILAVVALVLPLVGIGVRAWRARLTCWAMFVGAVFFAVWSQGDWMKGFRWYAISAVPGSILLAFGLEAVGRWLREVLWPATDRGRWLVPAVALAGVAGFTVPQVQQTIAVEDRPDARPQAVRKRVNYIASIRDRIHHEGPWVAMDVDMGGHLYWSDFDVLDMAGLVDVPFGHHRYQRPFVREYVFEQRRPHSAHVHGFWANKSGVPSHPRWDEDYFEIPGYGGRTLHIGNHIRRDLLMKEAWPHGDDRRVPFTDGWVLEGLEVPSEPARGRPVHLEIGLRTERERSLDEGRARLLLAARGVDGALATWDLPLGFDLLSPDAWRRDEVFVGRYYPRLPRALRPGPATLAVVLVGPDGAVLPALPEGLPEGAAIADGDGTEPLIAVGEVQLRGVLEVLPVQAMGRAAIEDREAAIRAADALRCDEAEALWRQARAHRADDAAWLDMHRPRVRWHLARCWAVWSEQAPDRQARIDALVHARELDHHQADVQRIAETFAEQLHTEGLQARAEEDWERAFQRFDAAVRVDRSRAWSRRYAEEARAHRLGIEVR